jgi:hypothetical protein
MVMMSDEEKRWWKEMGEQNNVDRATGDAL